jgi:ubiquinol-cytochrome c reductase iron-sulfur subunit
MSSDDQRPLSAAARVLAALVTVRTVLRTARGAERPSPEAPQRDIDPSERIVPANRRAETLVAALLLVAAVCGLGFVVVYIVLSTNTQLLGLAFGLMLALLAAAAIVAGKFVVVQETSVEERDELLVEPAAEEIAATIEAGGEGISRRALLAGAGGAAGAAALAAAAAPLASMGPRLHGIHTTPWHRGVRLIDDQGRPYAAADITVGAFYTALPEGGDPEHLGAGVLVVRLLPEQIHLPPARADWAPHGILAYSKICPHAGCAISLYRYPTYAPTSAEPAFTCPCHYSSFSPGEAGRLIFGPAGRSLPQLPLMIDPDGNLRAAAPFHEDIGPSWWAIRRSES